MSPNRSQAYLVGLVRELGKLPRETEWVEFKVNQNDPQLIGEYLSALANAAALNGQAFGYLVWGIDNDTHAVVGTRFSPFSEKKGNEPLETWLLRLLSPKIQFRFFELTHEGHPVVILEINRAFRHPVRFHNEAFLRVGEVKKPLKDAPDRERELWRVLDQTPFEDLLAAEHVTTEEVLRLLDYPAYFDSLDLPLPANRDGIFESLANDDLIRPCSGGGWDVTNLGALLLAKRLQDFPSLRRKAVRVIQYRGIGRTETLKEQEIPKGYANGFADLLAFISNLLPSSEVIGKALRETVPVFPELAIRELVANALIHQDLFATGSSPMVEIFTDRIEITSPGEPLVDTRRFVDTPPKSRNEVLASLMRRFRVCEERGSGIDKVIDQVEANQLPAPLFEVPSGFTRVVLFSHRKLSQMSKEDRVRACYLHSCLKWVMRNFLTNGSLRARFGVDEKNKATVSRYIREAVEAGVIKPFDEDAARKLMKYVPYWA